MNLSLQKQSKAIVELSSKAFIILFIVDIFVLGTDILCTI